jgi:phage terminase large subunit-like protein
VPPPRTRCAIGFDGARRRDGTALACCTVTSPGRGEKPHLWLPGSWERPEEIPRRDEWTTPAHEVDGMLAQLDRSLRIVGGYLDPNLWWTDIDRWVLLYRHAHLETFPVGSRGRMGAALERFRIDLLQGRFTHSGNPTLERHVLSARLDPLTGLLAKPDASEYSHIDGAIAAVLAYEAAMMAVARGADRSGTLVTW